MKLKNNDLKIMIDCIITSSDKTINYRNIKSVTIPAIHGEMQILSGHVDSFILLKKGVISLKQLNNQNKILEINGGECCVGENIISIIL